MGNFTEHIQQSKNNLSYLSSINDKVNNVWDWQVTVSFYVAVHIINAFVVLKTSKNYLSHNQVGEIINPYNQFPIASIDEDTYFSYNKLHMLSRRARYLLNENFQKKGVVDIQPACITYDKHFGKSIYHLDKIMDFIKLNSDVTFDKYKLKCIELKGKKFSNFEII